MMRGTQKPSSPAGTHVQIRKLIYMLAMARVSGIGSPRLYDERRALIKPLRLSRLSLSPKLFQRVNRALATRRQQNQADACDPRFSDQLQRRFFVHVFFPLSCIAIHLLIILISVNRQVGNFALLLEICIITRQIGELDNLQCVNRLVYCLTRYCTIYKRTY